LCVVILQGPYRDWERSTSCNRGRLIRHGWRRGTELPAIPPAPSCLKSRKQRADCRSQDESRGRARLHGPLPPLLFLCNSRKHACDIDRRQARFGMRLLPMSLVRPEIVDVLGVGQAKDGGAGGIRTLDRALQPYNGLANRRLQPLGHSSICADMPDARASRKRQIQITPRPFGGAGASRAFLTNG
jgi:hypothetical protein